MKIEIEIKTNNIPTVFMMKQDAPEWADINVPPVREQRNLMSVSWAIALVTITASVPATVIAGWLLDKIINKNSTTITINRKQVDLDKGQIIRVIEETKKNRRIAQRLPVLGE